MGAHHLIADLTRVRCATADTGTRIERFALRDPWHDECEPVALTEAEVRRNGPRMNVEHELGVAATKLRPPASPSRLVERPRLSDLLNDGLANAVSLLLVSAPAGSG